MSAWDEAGRTSGGGGGGRRGGVATGRRGGGGGGVGRTDADSYQSADRRYIQASDDVAKSLRALGNACQQIKKCTDAVGSKADSKRLRDRLKEEITKGRAAMASVNTKIRTLRETVGTEDRGTRMIQVQKFQKDFTDLVQKYKELCKRSEDIQREYIARLRSESAAEHASDGGKASEDIRLMSTMREMQVNEALIAEREAELDEIHKAVVDVNELYRDLADMVDAQGKEIDTVELHITEAHTHTEKGIEELHTASRLQKSARGKMLCIMMTILIIAGLIIAIVFLTKKKKK